MCLSFLMGHAFTTKGHDASRQVDWMFHLSVAVSSVLCRPKDSCAEIKTFSSVKPATMRIDNQLRDSEPRLPRLQDQV